MDFILKPGKAMVAERKNRFHHEIGVLSKKKGKNRSDRQALLSHGQPQAVGAGLPPKKERMEMSNNSNRINVPQAKQAMEQFKMQAASEVGVNLSNGYNGNLTSREAGSVGGQMVKKMIEAYEQGLQ